MEDMGKDPTLVWGYRTGVRDPSYFAQDTRAELRNSSSSIKTGDAGPGTQDTYRKWERRGSGAGRTGLERDGTGTGGGLDRDWTGTGGVLDRDWSGTDKRPDERVTPPCRDTQPRLRYHRFWNCRMLMRRASYGTYMHGWNGGNRNGVPSSEIKRSTYE